MKKHATIDYYIQSVLITGFLLFIILSFMGYRFFADNLFPFYLIIGFVQILSLAIYYFRFRKFNGGRRVYAFIILIQFALLIISAVFEFELTMALLAFSLFGSPLQLLGYFMITRAWFLQEKLHDALYLR
jgi:hypothetical protein